MKLLLIACLVLGFAFGVNAQETAPLPPLPPGPIPAPPEFAKWKVTILTRPTPKAPGASGDSSSTVSGNSGTGTATGDTGSGTDPATGGQHVKRAIEITKTKNLLQIEVSDDNGRKRTYFCTGNTQYLRAGDGTWQEVRKDMGMPNPIFTESVFPECTWISRNNYVAVTKVSGRPCFFFSDKVLTLSKAELQFMEHDVKSPPQQLSLGDYTTSSAAAIDMQTLLPLSMKNDSQAYTYQYETPPDSMLQIPRELLRQIEVRQQLEKDLSRKPAAS